MAKNKGFARSRSHLGNEERTVVQETLGGNLDFRGQRIEEVRQSTRGYTGREMDRDDAEVKDLVDILGD